MTAQDNLVTIYERYFESGDYARRYPDVNRNTLSVILAHGGGTARRILDFGCGNGRYALALLERTAAHLTGFDVTPAALAEFGRRLRHGPYRHRVEIASGSLEALDEVAAFDVVLALFGVLGHISGRDNRIDTLKRLRRSMNGPDGRLILSVPSVYRRRPREFLAASLRRAAGHGAPDEEAGDIVFRRHIDGADMEFHYHLYTPARLRLELEAAGFRLLELRPESVLPEWFITQWPAVQGVERAVLPLLPSALGYGIIAVAEPA
ncbi:MAG TPA: class I SAM-dependent methyltransferase [Azospirillaceae bacterium]|nr:class I SAM-dependent methyltransferase [Azospirillaceae bacterium]